MKKIKPFITPKRDKKPWTFRRVLGDLLIFLFIALTVYNSAVMIYKICTVNNNRSYITILGYELVICAVLILFAFDVRTGFLTVAHNSFLRFIGWVGRILICALTCLTLGLTGFIIVSGVPDTSAPADNAIVLGMALENGKPNSDLTARVDAAASYAVQNPSARLIASGGNGSENVKSEAQVIKDLLTERGIAASRIITEDSSSDTKENFANTAAVIGNTKPVVIITNSFHMQRAASIAEKAGFKSVLRLPARSDPLFYISNVMWELISTINNFIFAK